MNALPKPQFAPTQLEDLAKLLSRTFAPGNLSWLSTVVLGKDILRESGNSVGDRLELSKLLVRELDAAGAVTKALDVLDSESQRSGYLVAWLEEIRKGARFEPDNLQALINKYEPFINVDDFNRMLPRLQGVVCAVAVDSRLRGTGFLIGPDLVMTNFHVLLEGLQATDTGAVELRNPRLKIQCVFDYRREPPPDLTAANANKTSGSVIVDAADLVYASVRLPGDGLQQHLNGDASRMLDYAVIRLSQAIGGKPSRSGGGPVRGWLKLPDTGRDYLRERRIIVFQHPDGAAQQMDIGALVQLDSSSTRVWYSVNTAKGSSGGAAVAPDGELLALHNAAVKCPPAPVGVNLNQGIRIDLIADHLMSNVQGWQLPGDATLESQEFWSLTDDLDNPRPIIGRRLFREHVTRLMGTPRERALTVVGDYGTFARFSVALLQRILGNHVVIARFSPTNMQTIPPDQFVRVLLDQLGISSDPEDSMPAAPPTETRERWLAIDLPSWVARQLARHAATQPGELASWVVIDVTLPAGEAVIWQAGLRDLVMALVGARDAATFVDIPQLRWLFLSSSPMPLGTLPRLEEDLKNDTRYRQDFADCMQLAWRAIDKDKLLESDLLVSVADDALEDNEKRPAAQRIPARKLLATKVSRLLSGARRR